MSDQPSKEVCAIVDRRDGWCCARCGASLECTGGSRHHRKLRGHCRKDERHTPANIVLLCGSGTTGCHGWVHAHPALAYEAGWLVHSYEDPRKIPVRHRRYGVVLLADDGGTVPHQMDVPSGNSTPDDGQTVQSHSFGCHSLYGEPIHRP